MKKIFYFSSIIISLSFLVKPQSQLNYYGEKFSLVGLEDYSINKNNFLEELDDPIMIQGEILSTCPKKGCWMRIRAEEDTILVRFKDYGFFVPTQGVERKEVIINGDLSIDTLTVPQLRHYAEDAGKALKDINKINEPEITMSFLASGVIIKE